MVRDDLQNIKRNRLPNIILEILNSISRGDVYCYDEGYLTKYYFLNKNGVVFRLTYYEDNADVMCYINDEDKHELIGKYLQKLVIKNKIFMCCTSNIRGSLTLGAYRLSSEELEKLLKKL